MAWHSGKRHLGPQVTGTVLHAGREQVSALLAAAGRLTSGVLDPVATAQSVDVDLAFGDPASNEQVLDVVTFSGWLRSLDVT